MNLKQQREAALKAAHAISDGAKASKREMTKEEITELQGHIDAVKAFDVQIAEAEASSAAIDALAAFAPEEKHTPAVKAAHTLGEHFVKSMGDATLKTPGTIISPEFKASTDSHSVGGSDGAYGPLITDVDRNVVLPRRERLTIADLLGSGSVGGNAITYPVFGALEGGTGFIKEGGGKPQLHVADPTWKTDALGEVAGWFKITDDMAEDIPYIVSEINSTAVYDLQYREEQALLNGDGTSNTLTGILERTLVQTHNQDDDTVADAIFKAISKVSRGSIHSADGIVINPIDYEALRLSKDSNEQYLGGGFFQGPYGNGIMQVTPPIWGLRTVITPAIASGTVLVGAFAPAKVFRKGGLRVESTNSHSDDFTNDKITVRVRERIGFQVKYPAAFVDLTLGNVST